MAKLSQRVRATSGASSNRIGTLIKELRKRMGLTQEKFAAKAGVTLPTVNRWENGRTEPSPLALGKIKQIAQELGRDGVGLLQRYLPRTNEGESR